MQLKYCEERKRGIYLLSYLQEAKEIVIEELFNIGLDEDLTHTDPLQLKENQLKHSHSKQLVEGHAGTLKNVKES